MDPFFLSPANTPEFFRSREILAEGSTEFTVEHTMTPQAWAALASGHAEQIEPVVFANGTFTGRAAMAPLAEGVICRAGLDGRAMMLTTYDDPQTGATAYSQSHRTERLVDVITHTREKFGHDSDQPLSLLGQSRGWISVVQAADALKEEQRISSLTGVAPIGHLPHNITVCAQDVLRISGLTAQEMLRISNIGFDAHRWRAALAIGANALMHSGVSDFASVRDMVLARKVPLFHEVQELLTTDVTEEVLALSQRMGKALTMIACMRDSYAPARKLAEKFDNLEGFMGRLMIVDTGHIGSLTNKKRILPAVYDALGPPTISE